VVGRSVFIFVATEKKRKRKRKPQCELYKVLFREKKLQKSPHFEEKKSHKSPLFKQLVLTGRQNFAGIFLKSTLLSKPVAIYGSFL
jgi:hypothetical protein